MIRFALARLLYSVIVLFGVLILVFVVVDQIGDPARLMLPAEAPQAVYLALRESLGLNDPFLVRFWRAMSGYVVGDFGDSLWQGVPALPLALSRLPATFFLTAVALAIAVPLALFLGTRSAVNPGSRTDRTFTVVSLAGVSVADFWLGLMLILVVGVQLDWLPTSGFGGITFVILPALALAARPIGRLAQVARSALVEEMNKPYINTLRAKGLPEGRIVRRHALQNSAIPIITVAGDEIATFLNGAVVIETIFAWPGIGSLFIEAIERRDLPLIQACVFVVALMVITVNFVVDVTYAWLDPRTRSAAGPRRPRGAISRFFTLVPSRRASGDARQRGASTEEPAGDAPRKVEAKE